MYRAVEQALAADSVQRGRLLKGEAEVNRDRAPLKRCVRCPLS